MNLSDTGLLRCVVEDELMPVVTSASSASVRSGSSIKQAVPIIFDDHQGSKGDTVMRRWQADAALPVGDRFLCWVNYLLGFILCDMAMDDMILKLRPPLRDAAGAASQ